jgi:hypothetical protein
MGVPVPAAVARDGTLLPYTYGARTPEHRCGRRDEGERRGDAEPKKPEKIGKNRTFLRTAR